MPIAILGLGIIGSIWARNLQADGITVNTWNRSKRDFPGFCDSPVTAITNAELILIVVADPNAVQEVLNQILPALKPNQIVMQSSTISAEWTLKFADQVAAQGAIYLDAPFTGSKPAAEQRKTVFYIGGESSAIEKIRPIISKQALQILHVGSIGAASNLKLAMNMNIALVMEALSESRRFALSQGLSDEIFFEALKNNVSRSGLCDLKEMKLRNQDFSPQFSLKHMNKDLGLAKDSAKSLELPMFGILKKIYDRGMEKGLAEQDFTVLDKLLG